MRANMGCGSELWGEIRIDLKRGSSANVLADLQFLPFRDDVFCDIRCISVLEHIDSWRSGLLELLRVSKNRIILEVPVNSDIRKTDVFRLLLPTPRNLRYFFTIPERARETKWQIKPGILEKIISKLGFSCHVEKVFQIYCGAPSRCWRLTLHKNNGQTLKTI